MTEKFKTQKSLTLIIFILACVGFLLRFYFMTDYLANWDAVDFALGLREYNLAKYQPHPPGYPIYMMFAKGFFFFFKNDILSLTLTNALFGALTIVPFYYLVHAMYGKREAVLAAILLIINPLHWLMSTKTLSDTIGVFFAVLSVFFLYKGFIARQGAQKFLILASLSLGLCLGVRLSYFPLLVLWGFVFVNLPDVWQIQKYSVLTLLITICAWVLGQRFLLGDDTFLIGSLEFMKGHFTQWGGTVLTHPNLIDRLNELFVQDIFIHGLGGGTDGFLRCFLSVCIGASFFFYFFHQKTNNHRERLFLLWWGVPYLLWVFLGQNLNNPRHVLFLIPVFLVILARGLTNMPHKFRYASIAVFIISLLCLSMRLMLMHRQTKSAGFQLVEYVKAKYEPEKTIIFSWEIKRLFDYYAPQYIIIREESLNMEESIASNFFGYPENILITSDTIKYWNSKNNGMEVLRSLNSIKEFHHNPYVQNAYHDIVLYSVRP